MVAAGPPRWRDIVADGRLGITIGLILVEFVAGIESLVVTAVMPQVLTELGGIDFYGWVFTGYYVIGFAAIPMAGHQADSRGPARPFLIGCGVFAVGTVLCGLAPAMWLLAAARLVQGFGGALLYTVGYAAIAKIYPEPMRPRVVALLTLIWVVSGLVGPPFGALVAASIGWRWAFLAVLPLLGVTVTLVTPRFVEVRRVGAGRVAAPPLRWPVALATGTAAVFAALTDIGWWSAPVVAAGLSASAWGLHRLLPPGWWQLRPGFPAVVSCGALLNLGFFGTDVFVPLAVTGVRGASLLAAGVTVTAGTLGWTLGGWWQSRVVATAAAIERFTRNGALLIALGTVATATVLFSAPLWLAYAGWFVAGTGMGIAFSAVMVATMDSSAAGQEGAAISARFISGRVGIVVATGGAGACVSLGSATALGLRGGLVVVFALGLIPTLAAALSASRLAPR